jgi:hypothetical protein
MGSNMHDGLIPVRLRVVCPSFHADVERSAGESGITVEREGPHRLSIQVGSSELVCKIKTVEG